jgi:hypothetical protein
LIPPFNQSGVLPPFLSGSDPTIKTDVSPYPTTFNEFSLRFSTSPERNLILNGLVEYSKNLSSLGINKGVLWVDGSFTEDVEKVRGRAPGDIDLVLFMDPLDCGMTKDEWRILFHSNQNTLHPQHSKSLFKCDAYIIDLSTHPLAVVNNTTYFSGLFSHQKTTNLWKGMLKIELEDILSTATNGIPLGGINA